jgi:ATP-dependent helicase HrpB
VLAFLPGAPEIRRLQEELRAAPLDFSILPLHGSLEAEEQDRALAPSDRRKLILATNLAETSLTIDGVTDVVDTGLHKVLRYDQGVGLDRLVTERISADSATQRAGRAGRTGPGRVLRLWDPRDHLRPHREPEIERVDLAAPFLDVLAWGGDPRSFAWFEPPPPERAEAALALLTSLGAIHDRRITPLGKELRRLPLHPRLARVLIEAGGGAQAAAVCAVLAEGFLGGGAGETRTTSSDLLARADAIARAPYAVRAAAAELLRMAPASEPVSEERLLRAVLAGYPDRVAKRRERNSPRLLLASGHGAVLARESGVRDAEWLVAVDAKGGGTEALVRAASAIERGWLTPDRSRIEHVLREGTVRAFSRSWYGALLLAESPAAPDPDEAARLLAGALRARELGPREQSIVRRSRFAEMPLDVDAWIERACQGRTSLEQVDLVRALPHDVRGALDRLAPETLELPAGRPAKLEYREDGTVATSVRLQSVAGLSASPRIGPRRVPVTFLLLAPNGRPVQTTQDLDSFWKRVYPEIRTALRARYPKHSWP